jgi:hypothetical protein
MFSQRNKKSFRLLINEVIKFLTIFWAQNFFLCQQPYRPTLRHQFTGVQNRHSEAGNINLFKKIQRGQTQPDRKIIRGFKSLQHGNIFHKLGRNQRNILIPLTLVMEYGIMALKLPKLVD